MDNRIAFLPPQKQRFNWAGYLLGFALGGCFDGILLHQILQWHHFLSGIKQPPFDALSIQLMADGVFQIAMFLVAAVGVRKLLQARYVLIDRSFDRVLAADLLIGFGAWNMVDGLVAHWALALHHVRMDVPDPSWWDLLWFLLFGVLFVAAGIAMRVWHDPSSADDLEKRRRRRSTPM